MVDLTPLCNALIAVLAAVITAFVVPWLKAKFTETQLEKAEKWAKIAVQAAEMIYSGCADSGLAKKNYAIGFLEAKGFTLDSDELNAVVESAVLEVQGKLNSNANEDDSFTYEEAPDDYTEG